jgi:single-strand DNA-binding protein
MINKATIVGRIGKKDYRPTKTGGNMLLLSVCTDKSMTTDIGEHRTLTTWHNINMYSKLADTANKYIKVGDMVFIMGEIQNRKVEDEKGSRWLYSITAHEFKVLASNKKVDEEEKQDLDDDFFNR